MKWHDLDVRFEGDGKLTIENDSLIVQPKCRNCGKLCGKHSFDNGLANTMLERANIQRFPDSEPIARNEIIDVDIRCSQCSREVKGKLNLEIPQAYLDRVREQRFHGEYEGVYADLIQIKTRFEGASVPTHFFDARDGLCVKCGRCANVTYLTEVAVPFNQLCEAITSYFTDDPMIPQAKVIDEKPFCPYCGQKIKVKITLTPTLPKSRAEIVKAYLNWEKRPK